MKDFYQRFWITLALIAITIGVFLPVLRNEFINFDDGEYVTENVLVRAGLTWEGIKWAFATRHAANWHPMTWISHMLDVEVYGMKPWGHHLTNLILHLATTLTLFGILLSVTGYPWRSALVAAFFAIHPLHVESVAWTAERKDVLSAFFWMVTTWSYISYVQSPRVMTYLRVMVLFALGLMSKPMLVTLPLVFLLLDYWPLRRISLARHSTSAAALSKHGNLILEKAPLFVLSTISCVITYIAQHEGEAVRTLQKVAITDRISNALVSYVAYLGKMLWPRNLAIFYPYPIEGLPIWQVVGSGLVLVSITLLAVYLAHSRRYLVVGWFWYLFTLVPVIGIIQVGSQAMADRYTYIPLIGIFIAIVWGVPDLLGNIGLKGAREGRKIINLPILPFASAVSLLALAICTRIQVGYWRDSVSLFEHTLAATKNNVVAHTSLGDALREKGKIKQAIAHYSRALEIYPFDPNAMLNLGVALAEGGMVKEAILQFKKALKVNPNDADAYNNLGLALASQGNLSEAVEHYGKALALRPDFANAHGNLGLALAAQGRIDEAIEHYKKAIQLNPNLAEVYNDLGLALAFKGDLDGAVRQFRIAVQKNPQFVSAYYNLGVALGQLGKLDAAIQAYRMAVRLNPRHASAHKNLAIALYEKGDYVGAWREIRLYEEYGGKPPKTFLKALSEKMPEN